MLKLMEVFLGLNSSDKKLKISVKASECLYHYYREDSIYNV